MTVRIPKVVLILTGLTFFAGAGGAVGYYVADSQEPDTITSTETEVSTSTSTATTTNVETLPPVPSTTPGSEVINDLLEQGEIDDYTDETPKFGWDSQFDLGVADTTIRFKESPKEVEWVWRESQAGDDLNEAIDSITDNHGYTESVG